jgi:hypothetical protein
VVVVLASLRGSVVVIYGDGQYHGNHIVVMSVDVGLGTQRNWVISRIVLFIS